MRNVGAIQSRTQVKSRKPSLLIPNFGEPRTLVFDRPDFGEIKSQRLISLQVSPSSFNRPIPTIMSVIEP